LIGGYPRAPGAGVVYLAGEGLIYRGEGRRESLPPGTSFTVAFRAVPTHALDAPPAEGAPSFIDALQVMGLLGGLGSRVRRGFGSLRITAAKRLSATGAQERQRRAAAAARQPAPEPETDEQLARILTPATLADYQAALGRLLIPRAEADTPFSTINADSQMRLIRWKPDSETLEQSHIARMHDALGRSLQRERSYHPQEFRKKTKWTKFYEDDHDWHKRRFNHQTPVPLSRFMKHPIRIAFGLPFKIQSLLKHPNGTKYTGEKVEISPDKIGAGRRASPLLLHLTVIEGHLCGVWLHISGRFLPKQTQLRFSDKRAQKEDCNAQPGIIRAFLAREPISTIEPAGIRLDQAFHQMTPLTGSVVVPIEPPEPAGSGANRA
jgi:CRISPR-associated protein Cmr1